MSHLIGDSFLIATIILFGSAYIAFNINIKSPLSKTLTLICIFMGIGSLMNAFQFYSKTTEMSIVFSNLSWIWGVALIILSIGLCILILRLRLSLPNQNIEFPKTFNQTDQSAASNKEKDDFISLISHELLSPLSAIILWTNLAKNDHSLQTKALEVIEENARKQILLVDELLLFTRLQKGNIILNPTNTDINEIVSNIINQLEINSEIDKQRIIFDKKVENIHSNIDIEKFSHIIKTLIINSTALTNDESKILINTFKENNFSKICIIGNRDTEEALSLNDIFNPFHKENEKNELNTSRLYLAVALSLAELHGGNLKATTDNHQLTFTLQIPSSSSFVLS